MKRRTCPISCFNFELTSDPCSLNNSIKSFNSPEPRTHLIQRRIDSYNYK